jgi:hypothetical protein
MFAPDDVLSLDNVSPVGQRIVADHVQAWKAFPTSTVSGKGADALLNCGATKRGQLAATGQIDSYLDGSLRLFTVASIFRYKIRQAIASHPLDAPVVKARHPVGEFKRATKAPRPRTPAELEGLRKGNAKRAAEAQARRAAKEAATPGI